MSQMWDTWKGVTLARVFPKTSSGYTPFVPGFLDYGATAGGADEACSCTSGRWCTGAAGAQH